MTSSRSAGAASRTPLRLWPGVAAVVLLWLFWLPIPRLLPEAGLVAMFAAMACALATVVWWLFFSRAPWLERVGAILLIVAATFAIRTFVHPSIAGGMMGMMLPLYSIPMMCLALVVWAAAADRLPDTGRRVALVACILVASGSFTLVRTAGIVGGNAELHWRWTPSPEERLLADAAGERLAAPPRPAPAEEASSPKVLAPAAAPAHTEDDGRHRSAPASGGIETKWSGFRGPARDSVVNGRRIATDWAQNPPVELWRRAIGPGWSSLAVRGNLIYTQEQRGEEELVSAYNLATGEPVWRHRDGVRFWESNGGAGPRATPTVHDDRVYTMGATGIVNALDADTGTRVWSRDAAADTGRPVPDWGFSSSPLVVGDVVIVHAGLVIAYDIRSGAPRWVGPPRGGGYSSAHAATLAGTPQVLMMTGLGATSFAPSTGMVLWQHDWSGTPIVQPAVTPDADVLISSAAATGGMGVRRLAITHRESGWSVEERWTSNGLKPYYNDFVIHKDHAYGFDGSILACIDLQDGSRKWKGGRYGNGQMVLLADQDLLLVLSEHGELVLVAAAPDQHHEVARVQALEGKTWNHPVVIGDILLARNGEEMAAYRLPTARP